MDGAVTGIDDVGVVLLDLEGVVPSMASVSPSTSLVSMIYDGELSFRLSALGSLRPIPGVVPILSSADWSIEADLMRTRLALTIGAGAGVTWICGISDVDPDAELLVDPRRSEKSCGRVKPFAAVGEAVV